MSNVRLLPSTPLVVGSAPPIGRVRTRVIQSSGTVGDVSSLARVGHHAQSVLSVSGGNSVVGQIATSQAYRLLTPDQMDLIYQRCSDVRSCIDGIVRRVATHDWVVAPTVAKPDPRYEAALEAGQALTRWLTLPNSDQETWQELVTRFLTDLLKYDAGCLERVRTKRRVTELVALRGCDVHPLVDDTGRIQGYRQVVTAARGGSLTGVALGASTPRDLSVDQILYMMLFPNTISTEGMPLMEALIYEIIAILRAAEFWAHSVDLNEIPPGLLVVTGVAGDALARMEAEYQGKAAQDWRLRFLGAEQPGDVDAKWVQLRRDPRDLQLSELADPIRRAIWRVFGVMPVEQGATEGMPRATARVQLDVSSSHLLEPIMELLAAKLNALVVSELVDPSLRDVVSFQWVDHRDLTADEKLNRAKKHEIYVKQGVMTRDEVREELGMAPLPDAQGDVVTVESGGNVLPLGMALEGPQEPVAPAPTTAKGAQGGGETKRAVGVPRAMPRPPLMLSARSIGDGEIPGAWRSGFKGDRTVDLVALWDQIQGYERDVEALWAESAARVVGAVAAEYADGALDDLGRTRLFRTVSEEVAALQVRWAVATRSRYLAVAEQARARAGNWTGRTRSREDVEAAAASYAARAIGYLMADRGILSDALARTMAVLFAATTEVRDRRSDYAVRGLSQFSKRDDVVQAIAESWDALRSRIRNWAGKLVELAQDVLAMEVLTASTVAASGGSAPVEWLVEWASNSDERTCPTCSHYGSQGFLELSTLSARPGSVDCRGNCRCVLVMWTREEVNDGTAVLRGAGNVP
jgi:hypothetical protein